MLTGVSPFRTGSAPDTLMRICTARQVPVRELRPEVTEGVSNLVDHLLEKESAFRPPVETVLERLGRALPPHMSSTVKELIDEPTAFPDPALLGHARLSRRALLKLSIAILALMTLIIFRPGLGGLVGRYGRAEPLYLAVPKSTLTEHSTDDERATLLAGALRLALLQGATRIEGIVALSPDQVDPVKGDPKVIARATAASEVLVSELDCGAESCRRVELRRVLGSDGRLLWARSFEAPLDNPYVLVEAVGGYLEQAYSDRPMVAKTFIGARPEDFAKYLQLRQQYDVEQWRNPPPEFLGALAAIRRSSPRFLEANLFEAEILLYRFGSSHDAEDLRRTSLILQEARELAPFDSRPLALAFNLEMTRGELSRAAEALKQLELQQPGSTATMIRRAQLLERQGRIDEAVGWMRDAVRRHPSWRNLAVAAEMEYRLGRFASSRHYLEDLLARFPEHQLGLSMLGQIELSVGSPERAVEIYAEIANRSPQPGVLVNLGLAHMLLGNYGQAAEFLQQAARLETKNPVIMLDLGDAHFLNGKSTEAGEDYKRVLFLVDQGTSKSDWQNHSVRAQALAHLGQRREAVAAVQELLRMAPNNAQASYEASLVYVLVGDEASALFNAERALELGVEPRWFRFPWFDPLRRTKFRDRLMLAESRRNV
jgi:tetratricopeptide (TPR) repeat protein